MNLVKWAVLGLAAAAVLGAPGASSAMEVSIPGEGHAQNPVWSLDGNYLAFEVNPLKQQVDLFFVSAPGGIAKTPEKVALAGGGSMFGSGQVVANPAWHPAGFAIFEGSNQGGTYRLYFGQPGGASPSEMIQPSVAKGNLTFPAVSPDGMGLSFVSQDTGNGDVVLWSQMAPTKITQVTNTPGTEAFPTYSPDGKKLAFTRKVNDSESLFVYTMGGSEASVANEAGDQTRPQFAGGGKQLVYFTSERGDDKWDIAIIGVDGSGKRILAKDVRLPMRARPAVSPDGQWVAYGYNDPTKNTKIAVVKTDGSKTIEIPTDYVACGEPALTKQNGRMLLAYTALPSSDSDWRKLMIEDITDKVN